MPVIYTEDQVGKAVEQHYLGSQGVSTGSGPNAIGLADYDNRRRAEQAFRQTLEDTGQGNPPGCSTAHGEAMLPLFESMRDAIPVWLRLVLAVVGSIGTFAAFSAATSGTAWGLLTFAAGGFAGWVMLPLIIVVCDFVVRLTWALLKLALVLAGIAAAVWVAAFALGF